MEIGLCPLSKLPFQNRDDAGGAFHRDFHRCRRAGEVDEVELRDGTGKTLTYGRYDKILTDSARVICKGVACYAPTRAKTRRAIAWRVLFCPARNPSAHFLSSFGLSDSTLDICIIGAGAAGLMAAIAGARAGASVRVLDGAKHIGAKILVSGGSRCNVTNEYVAPARFHGEGAAPFVSRILRSFSPADTHRFFAKIGVELKLEETGKFFPVSDSSRTVLNALLAELSAAGAVLSTQTNVSDIEKVEGGWKISTPDEEIYTRVCRRLALFMFQSGNAIPIRRGRLEAALLDFAT